MANIRWVCLSDLHFGAENSVLSRVPDGEMSVDPNKPSDVLKQLVVCLRKLVETNEDGILPTLVLHGDILEFALAEDNIASMTFASFLNLVFATEFPLFQEVIYYVPGNHDHHLWENSRERQFAKYVEALPLTTWIEPPLHTTPLFEDDESSTPEAALVNALLTRVGKPDLRCKVVYPNFGLESSDQSRVVVIHHGHFTEPLYLLMSGMKTELFPLQPPGNSVQDWETNNFAWIDFFWSTLGRSGTAGSDVGLIYDMLQEKTAMQRLAVNLARFASKKICHFEYFQPFVGFIFSGLARWLVPQVATRERGVTDQVLGDSTAKGLVEYLAGPLRAQLESGRPDSTKRDVTFVFGHTHKPFERPQSVSGYASPVSIVNSGGWVVDTRTTSEFQGGAVILIDEDCAVASIRMYNQGNYQVRIAESGSATDRRFQARLSAQANFGEDPWTTFSSAVKTAVDNRHDLLPRLIARGVDLAGG